MNTRLLDQIASCIDYDIKTGAFNGYTLGEDLAWLVEETRQLQRELDDARRILFMVQQALETK